MKFFVTGVGGQLGHDVMNELLKRGHEGVGSDIQENYSGVADGSAVTKAPYVALDITDTIITNKHVVNHKQDENVKFHLHLREENGESNTSIGIKMNAHWYFHSTKDLCFTFVNPVFEGVKKAYGTKV